VLGVSPATIKRDWGIAKGWLQRELARSGRDGFSKPRAVTSNAEPSGRPVWRDTKRSSLRVR